MNGKRRPRLVRQDWIDAGIERLAHEGIGAVSVERLAGQLDVTRGSFYHHFNHREELLRAMLDYWAERWTYRIREQLAGLDLDPGTTLLALMRLIRVEGASRYDAPFRAWALHDDLARQVVERVDRVRLDFIRSLFEGLGFTGLDLENRTRLFLYYEAADPAMLNQPPAEQDEALLLLRHRLLTTPRTD